MTDETAGLLLASPARDGANSPHSTASRRGLGVGAVMALSAAAALAVGTYSYRFEGGAPNQFYVTSANLLSAALVVLATRRVLVAAVLISALAGIIVQAGAVKHKLVEMNVHAYDVFFYLTSGPTLHFLASEYGSFILRLGIGLAAIITLVLVAYRLDGTRIPRRISGVAVIVLVASTALAAHIKGERSHTQQYWDDLTLSTFYSSMADTAEALWRGQLIEAGPPSGEAQLVIPASCTPIEKPPHIVLIHQESVVPPGVVPGVTYDKSLDSFFQSFDGLTHHLRVETYGGASWLTEFSILTGVSTYAFGGMRAFVHSLMSGKIKDTLPQSLSRCGYRNVVFFPGDRNFVSYAKFYTSAGMGEIFDSRDMKASRLNERDRFFYGKAMEEMARHFKASGQPLFTYVLTMATHGPYNRTYMPEVSVPGGGPGITPEMNEYLRRLAMAKTDFEEFMTELERRFPNERFLVVHYGDHHPVATRAYLGYADIDKPQDVPLARDSVGYITYYAMRGIRYAPPDLPAQETLDVPYLGTLVLDAARLPLSDAYKERKRLLAHCQGRYDGCSDRQQILSFHRRLIESGLLQAR